MASEHLLIAYATAHGSTAEIARHIARRLDQQGTTVAVTSVTDITSIDDFDAVMIGSAVHNRSWLPQAAAFIQCFEEPLGERRVWTFSVGMPGALARPFQKWGAIEEDQIMATIPAAITVQSHRLFSGVVQRTDFSFMSRIILRLMGGHFGDFRDWDAINRWADEVSDGLRQNATEQSNAEQ
jgi:menaquinone-dependent protoporphyrinogen oxidase